MSDQPELSPAEAMLLAADPDSAPGFLGGSHFEGDPVIVPWSPTGNENPQRTIKPADDLTMSPPPPETAGGSIPSAHARFRQFGPDES
jgi:hypothetical protein